MQLNLSNQTETVKPQYFVAIGEDGEIESSKPEMLQIIESMRGDIDYLKTKIKSVTMEKDSLIDNFCLSSGVLLERIKDLEMFKSQAEARLGGEELPEFNEDERP